MLKYVGPGSYKIYMPSESICCILNLPPPKSSLPVTRNTCKGLSFSSMMNPIIKVRGVLDHFVFRCAMVGCDAMRDSKMRCAMRCAMVGCDAQCEKNRTAHRILPSQ